jgi:hypothetical protein
MTNLKHHWMMIGILVATLAGCNNESEQETTNVDGSLYQLTAEPAGAISILELRSGAKDNDEVVVVGRIGGSRQPWIKGLSAFTMMDTSFPPCNELPEDQCPTPWDYCCEAELPTKQTLIKVVDNEGQPLEVGAQELLGLKELQTIVVQGKVQLDQAGNMSVLASGVYIRR